MAGFGPQKPREIVRQWLRWIAGVAVVWLLVWGILALRSRPPVPFQRLSGEAPGFNDGTWDHFEALAVERNLSDADLQKLLDWLQQEYTATGYNRVRIVIFNSRAALTMADADALVAEYRQDRSKREFTKTIVD